MIKGTIKVDIAEKKPNPQPTYGGVVRSIGPGTKQCIETFEMYTESTITKDEILSMGIIPDVAPDDLEHEYLELLFGFVFSYSPKVIPEYLDVEMADHLFDHCLEFIGKILGSRFWMVTLQEVVEGCGYSTSYSVIAKDEYMATRSKKSTIVIDGTRHPRYYRELADGRLEKVIR